jgi:hypothetical protein
MVVQMQEQSVAAILHFGAGVETEYRFEHLVVRQMVDEHQARDAKQKNRQQYFHHCVDCAMQLVLMALIMAWLALALHTLPEQFRANPQP